MKISELKSPYRELAELRRKQEWIYSHEDELKDAFIWNETPETVYFWCDVYGGEYPPIHKSSLKELEESK